jgi:hypothetical protein
MTDTVILPSTRSQLIKEAAPLAILAICLITLSWYGVILLLASAPHLEAPDRRTNLQAKEITRLRDDVNALRRENAEMRDRLNASHVMQFYGVEGSPLTADAVTR